MYRGWLPRRAPIRIMLHVGRVKHVNRLPLL